MPDSTKTFMIEDAEIMFRNFSGRLDKFNKEGDRNFFVRLTDDIAAKMETDGWTINSVKARGEEDEDKLGIRIAVSWKFKPPRIVMITSNARTNLEEDTVEVLDWADLKVVDLIARGYDWDVNGKTGTKAYLKSLFVTIDEDYLERKYAINDPLISLEPTQE